MAIRQFRSRDELKKKIADLEDWAEVRKNICVSCIKPVKTMQQGQVFQSIDIGTNVGLGAQEGFLHPLQDL